MSPQMSPQMRTRRTSDGLWKSREYRSDGSLMAVHSGDAAVTSAVVTLKRCLLDCNSNSRMLLTVIPITTLYLYWHDKFKTDIAATVHAWTMRVFTAVRSAILITRLAMDLITRRSGRVSRAHSRSSSSASDTEHIYKGSIRRCAECNQFDGDSESSTRKRDHMITAETQRG